MVSEASPPEAKQPSSIEIYTVAEERLEEAEAYLRKMGAQRFVHPYNTYFEVVVVYNGTAKTAKAAEAHREMGRFSLTELVLPIHIKFSCFEVMGWAAEEGILVKSFSAADKLTYSVTAVGSPRRLEKFWTHFSSWVD